MLHLWAETWKELCKKAGKVKVRMWKSYELDHLLMPLEKQRGVLTSDSPRFKPHLCLLLAGYLWESDNISLLDSILGLYATKATNWRSSNPSADG
jgi:hypothetical protein